MMDHASLFTETVHPYLPKLYILIYRNCTLLFTNYRTLLFTDYTNCLDNIRSNAYDINLSKTDNNLPDQPPEVKYCFRFKERKLP